MSRKPPIKAVKVYDKSGVYLGAIRALDGADALKRWALMLEGKLPGYTKIAPNAPFPPPLRKPDGVPWS